VQPNATTARSDLLVKYLVSRLPIHSQRPVNLENGCLRTRSGEASINSGSGIAELTGRDT
jgi:hypothetical protein